MKSSLTVFVLHHKSTKIRKQYDHAKVFKIVLESAEPKVQFDELLRLTYDIKSEAHSSNYTPAKKTQEEVVNTHTTPTSAPKKTSNKLLNAKGMFSELSGCLMHAGCKIFEVSKVSPSLTEAAFE